MPINGENQNKSNIASANSIPKYGQYNVPNANQMVNFGTGQPNNLNLPINWFQETCFQMSKNMFGSNDNEHAQMLQYGAIEGYPDIRNQMADWLTEKYYGNLSVSKKLKIGHKVLPSQLFMTNGNTGALHLIMSKYTESTDKILVDNPTYFIALNMFKEYGLEVEGIQMDPDGTNLEDLENKIINANASSKYKQSVLFYYMIPTHHNPTGITMSHAKRMKIAELCNKYDNLYIIADEVYHFLSWSESLEFYPMADYHPKIISLGSFSKILAPALRVGWIYQNNLLADYDDAYGFVTGTSSLSKSAVLDSSGGINPIGFKFVEYALMKNGETRPIDSIISTHVNYLHQNCQMMVEYLQQYSNIEFIEPAGGYFIWINFKTIKNVPEFAKYCEKNRIKFHAGNKFSTDDSYTSAARLSFSYYNSSDLIVGLERLMDCVHKYNCVNVMIQGSSGKLGTLIKQEILQNSHFNYVGDIGRTINKNTFEDLDPFNSVIVDVSSSSGTENLVSVLLANKIYIPLIIGTTGLTQETSNLVEQYSKFTKVAHITNFSQGIPLVRELAKLSNFLDGPWEFNLTDIHHAHKKDAPSGTAKTIMSEISRNVKVESIRVGEVIGTHTLELSNGSETVTITHKVADRNTFAKGCVRYLYWILTKSNGLYNHIDSEIPYSIAQYQGQNIVVYENDNNLPSAVNNKIITHMLSTKPDTNKFAFVKHDGDDDFGVDIYANTNGETKQINYCGYTLLATVGYITNNYETTQGTLTVGNSNYKYKHNDTHLMIEIPTATYIASKNQDEQISELITRVTNLTLFGVSRYSFDSVKYLILEMKEDIMDSEFLDTICAVISSEYPSNKGYKVLFINTSYYTGTNKNQINMRCFDLDSGNEICDNALGCSAVTEYYLFHFIKNYKETKLLEINLKGNHKTNVLYSSSTLYLYEKKLNKNLF